MNTVLQSLKLKLREQYLVLNCMYAIQITVVSLPMTAHAVTSTYELRNIKILSSVRINKTKEQIIFTRKLPC